MQDYLPRFGIYLFYNSQANREAIRIFQGYQKIGFKYRRIGMKGF